VVVPTWNRPAGLRRALNGLAVQADPGAQWEVAVVASAGGGRAVEAVVDSFRDHVPAPLRVEEELEPGASRARNRGLARARRVVAFLDDDCVPEPGWLAAVTAPVLAGAWAGAGGRVVADPAVPRPRWLGEALLAYLAAYDRGDEEVALSPDDYLLTANAAFDAELLAGAGAFDPLLGPTAGRPTVNDDVDICRKVFRAGGRILYVPSAVVIHDLPPSRLTPRYLVRRFYAQGRSDWLLDREELETMTDRGVGGAAGRLRRELVSILGQGPWHRSVALHAAGAVARAAGFTRQALGGAPPAGPG
jgi:GT2 family glycosyltransferase